MALTYDQLTLLGQKRKLNPPSFFNADTGVLEGISNETEDALILIGTSVKQKAAQYLDLLLETNPQKSDYDTILSRAVSKKVENAVAALVELEPVISNFEEFRQDLLGSGSLERLFSEGMRPLLKSLLRGIGPIRNRIAAQTFTKRINSVAEAKHSSNLTDTARKEWRSWKRVLLAYP